MIFNFFIKSVFPETVTALLRVNDSFYSFLKLVLLTEPCKDVITFLFHTVNQ